MHRGTKGFICALALALASGTPAAAAQRNTRAKQSARSDVALERRVRAHLGFLASDAMRGRASGTDFERIAAEYIGAQFQAYGLEPGVEAPAMGDAAPVKSFVQRVPTERIRYATAPTLRVQGAGLSREWALGKDFQVQFQRGVASSGPLGPPDAPRKGAWYFAPGPGGRDAAFKAYGAGAAGVIMRSGGRLPSDAGELPRLPMRLKGEAGAEASFAVVMLSPEAAAEFERVPEGATVTYGGDLGPSDESATWNAVGVLRGADPTLSKEVILLSAHLDHLGERPGEGDSVFNGADDDASGCAAVMELARALASGPRPKRTIYFVCFGSEEVGGLGSEYFIAKAPVPIEEISVNLNFEMIGRADPAVAAGELWLTGYERSNLGPALAARGARVVADPHPQERFFERSDNYTLAVRGVVAQSVSSFGLHKDYHQPGDEVSKIDFAHMARSIGSVLGPVRWLANARFRPAWLPGKDPTTK
jgi:hypothetical protein